MMEYDDTVRLTGILECIEGEEGSNDGASLPWSSVPLVTDTGDASCSGKCPTRPENHHISATPVLSLI
jgi:hypothetical protein